MTNVLEITAGNDEEIQIALTVPNEATGIDDPLDITGYTFFFTVKKIGQKSTDADDSDALVKVTWTMHADPAGGITVLLIPRDSTKDLSPGNYWCGIKFKTPGDIIKDIEIGTDTLRVRRQVTNRTS